MARLVCKIDANILLLQANKINNTQQQQKMSKIMPQNLHQDEQKIDGYLQQRRNTSSFELLQLFCKPEHTTISSHFFWDPIMTFFPNAPPDDQNFWILCQRIRITLYDLLNAYQIPMLSKTNLQSSRVLVEKIQK